MTILLGLCKIKNINKKKEEKEAIQKVREYETFDVTETDCDGPYSISVALEW